MLFRSEAVWLGADGTRCRRRRRRPRRGASRCRPRQAHHRDGPRRRQRANRYVPNLTFSCQILSNSCRCRDHLLFSPSSDFFCLSGPTGPQPMEHDGVAIDVSSDSDEAVDGASPTAGGDAGAPGSSSHPGPSVDRALWTAPESSAAAGQRFFRLFRPDRKSVV